MTCAGTGNADAVRMLIARGADVNAKEPSQNQTALMWAAAERHAEVVKTLIEHGADLQARTKKGFSALHFAAREGDLDVARLLLAAGVDINIRSQPAAAPAGAGRGGGRKGRWPELRGERVCRQHAAARRDDAGARAVRAVPARAGRRSKRERCGHDAAPLGGGHLGERGSEPGVRVHRRDERHSRSGRRSCSS